MSIPIEHYQRRFIQKAIAFLGRFYVANKLRLGWGVKSFSQMSQTSRRRFLSSLASDCILEADRRAGMKAPE